MKKRISLMVAVIMLMQIILPMVSVIWESGITIKSIAADTYEATVNGITWTYVLSNGEARNVKPKDKNTLPTEVTIPSELNEYPVTSIGNYAFENCSGLKSIIIPESVTSIGYSTFSGCSNLTSIAIPNNVTSIGEFAFKNCSSATSIVISENLDSIKSRTFEGCSSLTSIIIPESVTSIGSSAFSYCSSLTSIEIPNSVTSIGSHAFIYCSSLTSIEIPEGVTSIGDNAFACCSSLMSIEIPNSVTSIGIAIFLSVELLIINEENSNKIAIPEIIKRVKDEDDILYSENIELTNCSFDESGENLLIDIDKIKAEEYAEIEIKSGKLGGLSINITNGEWDISVNNDKSVIAKLSKDGELTISGQGNMKKYSVPNYSNVIEKIKTVKIEDGVTSIEPSIFLGCSNLRNITVGEENQYYSSADGILFNKDKTEIICFPKYKKETEYIIPENITSIGNYAFYGCNSLESITIPENVTSIGHQAFYGCNSLESITIPENVTSIGNYAFDGCKSLTIYCKSNTYAEKYAIDNNINYETDDKAPTIEIVGNPTEWTKEEVILTVNAEDEGCGLVEEAYSFDGGATWQEENSKEYSNYENIVIQVRDALGNVETQNVEVKIDKEAPTIEIVGNPTEWTKEEVTLTINAQDDLSGLAEEPYSFDGGETWQSKNSKIYTENTSNIKIQVKDKLGNVEEEIVDITKMMKLENIEITTTPTKTMYIEGELFDTAGMQVQAIYDNETTEEITNYTVINGENLTVEQTSVTISYTEKGIEKTAEVNITVIKKGDVNGDNKIDFMDILAINKHRLGKELLTGVYLQAAEVTGDGEVDFADILKINKYRLGKINSL